MEIEFDATKDAANVAKHGVSLAASAELEVAAIIEDDRYAEPRYRLYGMIDGVRYCLAATLSAGVVRAISFRRAHKKEYRRHVD